MSLLQAKGERAMNTEICPPFDTPCRFCSIERTNRIFERISINKVTGIYQSDGLGHVTVEIGEYCNNISDWCKNITQCPARLALSHKPFSGISADGTGIYAKLHTDEELKWKINDEGDITRTQEIIHFGQQVLSV
jgi:hypothetical protein